MTYRPRPAIYRPQQERLPTGWAIVFMALMSALGWWFFYQIGQGIEKLTGIGYRLAVSLMEQ